MSRGRKGSPIIREALDRLAALRDEHREIRLNYYIRAEEATNGRLLNRRGLAARIDPQEMLQMNGTYIRAYASEELLEWIAANPRLTFAQFERQMHDMTTQPEIEEEPLPDEIPLQDAVLDPEFSVPPTMFGQPLLKVEAGHWILTRQQIEDLPLGDLGALIPGIIQEARTRGIQVEIEQGPEGHLHFRNVTIHPLCRCDFPEIGHALNCPERILEARRA